MEKEFDFRLLNKKDAKEFEKLFQECFAHMENPLMLAVSPDYDVQNFLCQEQAVCVGAFLNDKLVGFCGLLFVDEKEFEEYKGVIDYDNAIAEIGPAIVSIKERGKGLMLVLAEKIVQEAKSRGFKKLFATAHPENIASQKSLTKLGMKKTGYIDYKNIYPRDVFAIDI